MMGTATQLLRFGIECCNSLGALFSVVQPLPSNRQANREPQRNTVNIGLKYG